MPRLLLRSSALAAALAAATAAAAQAQSIGYVATGADEDLFTTYNSAGGSNDIQVTGDGLFLVTLPGLATA